MAKSPGLWTNYNWAQKVTESNYWLNFCPNWLGQKLKDPDLKITDVLKKVQSNIYLVLAISGGIEASVVARPLIILAEKWQSMLSSKYSAMKENYN